ncbi:MAG: hypothetical protein GXY07_07465 [Candidatus Hydrogenedentes bacterium]|nr:hypothetical protein [Candidatus Hydrogenedentota bacterium]
MFNWLRKGKKGERTSNKRDDSIKAMMRVAEARGILEGDSLAFIPEITPMYKRASNFFLQLLAEQEPEMTETMASLICRYLFAKGVEGVMLWGASPNGHISILFHPKHLVGPMETDVPPHLHKLVVDSLHLGEELFRAHQAFVMEHQFEDSFDLDAEIEKTIEWMPRFGISYGLAQRYQVLMVGS